MKEIYAILETGGKQYRVAPGQKIDVDYLGIDEGEKLDLTKVLLIAKGENVTIGSPAIDGAKVTATSLGERKGAKIIVFKYKPKVRYRRKKGHRQLYTRLEIGEIVVPGEKPVKRVRKSKAPAEVTANGA